MAIEREQTTSSALTPTDGTAAASAIPGRYLRTAEIAARLGITPKTLRNKVAAGLFREREHFFRLRGLGPLWKWEAVVATIEGVPECPADPPVIPLARPTRGRTGTTWA